MTQQETRFIAFMEGVCKKFNAVEAVAPLSEGFMAYCEGTGESGQSGGRVSIPNNSLIVSSLRNWPKVGISDSTKEYVDHKMSTLDDFYHRNKFGKPTNYRPHSNVCKAIQDELEQVMSTHPYNIDYTVTHSHSIGAFGTFTASLKVPKQVEIKIEPGDQDETGKITTFKVRGFIGPYEYGPDVETIYTGSNIHDAVNAIKEFYKKCALT
jgi:hypothetical protein